MPAQWRRRAAAAARTGPPAGPPVRPERAPPPSSREARGRVRAVRKARAEAGSASFSRFPFPGRAGVPGEGRSPASVKLWSAWRCPGFARHVEWTLVSPLVRATALTLSGRLLRRHGMRIGDSPPRAGGGRGSASAFIQYSSNKGSRQAKGSFMAQKVQVLLIDDLDGSSADETVSFGLDGRTYEIDMSKKNADKLRKVLQPYLEDARRARPSGRKRAARAAGSRQRSAEIRRWAKSVGIEVSDRGRSPANVIEKYEAAH